jgi:chitin synthase
MYLAEDRILCLKIYTRLGQRFKLRYIPTAKAVVDPITTIPNLMGQRRRWINGTWYALQYVLSNTDLVYQSDHSVIYIVLYRYLKNNNF